MNTSESEEDRYMTMIFHYSKNTTIPSITKLFDDAKIELKEIKRLRKEISNIQKQIDYMPENTPEIHLLWEQHSIKNKNLTKSLKILRNIQSSIQRESHSNP